MHRPLIVNQLGPEVAAALAGHPLRPRVRDADPGLSPWQVADAEVLLTGPNPAWQQAPTEPPGDWPGRLGWVQAASTGIDWMPRWLLDGPVVTCGRGHNAVPIAEYVLGAMLLHEKRLDVVSIRSREAWGRHALGTLEGKVLGLAGYGAIGQAVAARAQAFGMRVAVWRRSDWSEDASGLSKAGSLAALADLSDHLVLGLPLTGATRHCVDATLLATARPGLHLINIARGGLVEQTALLDALDGHRLGFATLDVTDPEPLPAGHPIYTHPRIRLTPHISWSGQAGRARLTEQILANLSAYARGDVLRDVVDPARGY
jgi:phosphoglycerate dehydrogenase-like enzyme